jgi:mRNA interferase RelE/StbE
MASYNLEWKRSAAKELKSLPRETVARVLKAVQALTQDPFPPGVKKLVGADHTYRIRVGDYRIIYDVIAATLIVHILRVGHRRDVYHD